MRKTRSVALAAALLCCLALTGVALAEMYSDNYGVPWDARYGGGGLTSSDNYAINGTVGQGAIGWINSDNYGVGAGYWYGAIVEYRIYLPLVLRSFS
jgi:hypothetical protein